MRKRVRAHAEHAGITLEQAAAEWVEGRRKKAEGAHSRGGRVIISSYKVPYDAQDQRIFLQLCRAYGLLSVAALLRQLAYTEFARIYETVPAPLVEDSKEGGT
jgi:hypothetical protein